MSLLKDPEVSSQIKKDISVFLFRDLVETVPFFFKVNNVRFMEEVCSQLELKVYMPGDYIFYAGDESDTFCLINEGSVCVLGDEGQKRLAVLIKGSFFGELGLINGSPRSHSTIALTCSEISFLKKAAFEALRIRYPAFDTLISETAKVRLKKSIADQIKSLAHASQAKVSRKRPEQKALPSAEKPSPSEKSKANKIHPALVDLASRSSICENVKSSSLSVPKKDM